MLVVYEDTVVNFAFISFIASLIFQQFVYFT